MEFFFPSPLCLGLVSVLFVIIRITLLSFELAILALSIPTPRRPNKKKKGRHGNLPKGRFGGDLTSLSVDPKISPIEYSAVHDIT